MSNSPHTHVSEHACVESSKINRLEPDAIEPDLLTVCRNPKVNKRHGHTSFSGLEPRMRESMETSPRDVDQNTDASIDQSWQASTNIFSIPGGAATGDCWHHIFENIDFQEPIESRQKVIDQHLDRCGICTGPTDKITNARRQAVHNMVETVLHTPMIISGNERSFILAEVSRSARRSELEFNFALRQSGEPTNTKAIHKLLSAEWQNRSDRKAFLTALQNWDRQIPLGFMTGFIDLLCCHNDRFYILDWKSNRRSGHVTDFQKNGLEDEMARHAYFLQYLIYTVAVDAFLRKTLQGYEYEKHFGGIFYVFLRGVTGNPNEGIFADRPSKSLINKLARLLIGNRQGEP
jgi:exodeoxyribonuclease V beta subunit